MYTRKQKADIKAWWPYLRLMFMRDGSVMAIKGKNGAAGLLYTRQQAEAHLKARGLM